jgi:hypothetical protein
MNFVYVCDSITSVSFSVFTLGFRNLTVLPYVYVTYLNTGYGY